MESAIVTVEQLKALSSLSSNIDPELLENHLLIAQQLYCSPILGDALYNDIVSRFDSNTLTGDTETLYNEYIVPAIAFSAWFSCAPFLAYKTSRTGIQTQGSPDTVATTPEELSLYIARVENLKDFYCTRLNRYLIEDNYVKFPLFRSDKTPVETNRGGSLYLGFKHGTRCNPDSWMYR